MQNRKHKVIPYGVRIRSGSVGSIPANLFRSILYACGMKEDRFLALIDRYVIQAKAKADTPDQALAKANLGQELMKQSITFKTWVKGIEFLHVREFKLRVVLHHEDGRVTTHHTVVHKEQFSQPNRILADFYRSILSDLEMEPALYDEYMQRYITKSFINPNRKDKASIRAGISKELLKPDMTWKSWVKGMVFLAAVKLEFYVFLQHENGKSTSVLETVNLDDIKGDLGNDGE